MKKFTKSIFILLASIVITFDPKVVESICWPSPHTSVTFENQLKNGEKLTIHCKSKTKDLGVQETYQGQVYRFGFTAWPNTLYFCGLSWSGGSKVFDAYTYKRDFYRDCKHVPWIVDQFGINGPSTYNRARPGVFIPWY